MIDSLFDAGRFFLLDAREEGLEDVEPEPAILLTGGDGFVQKELVGQVLAQTLDAGLARLDLVRAKVEDDSLKLGGLMMKFLSKYAVRRDD